MAPRAESPKTIQVCTRFPSQPEDSWIVLGLIFHDAGDTIRFSVMLHLSITFGDTFYSLEL